MTHGHTEVISPRCQLRLWICAKWRRQKRIFASVLRLELAILIVTGKWYDDCVQEQWPS